MQFYSEQNSCMFIIPNGLIRNFHAEVWHRNRPIYTQINETNDELQLRIYASLASVSFLSNDAILRLPRMETRSHLLGYDNSVNNSVMWCLKEAWK